MKINIFLPYKEDFNLDRASAVSITIKNNFLHSIFQKDINIFGNDTNEPMLRENFIGVKKSFNFLKSKNQHIANRMCDFIKKKLDKNQIIEVHNRPYIFTKILKELPEYKICLFFHNNPKEMKGSKTVKERVMILENASLVYCVSEYIKKQFLEGIDKKYINIVVLNNGVERSLKAQPKKNKEVLFVGRIVPEKGVHLYVEAIAELAPAFLDWKFYLIGSSRLGSNNNNKFAENLIKTFNQIGIQAEFLGFRNQKEIFKKMEQSSIIVVPSIWPEPFGLVIIEAMSYGTAIISSKVGGIPEIVKNNGILFSNINGNKIKKALTKLMRSDKELKKYQQLSWNNFNHSSKKSSKSLDSFRKTLM